MNTFLNALLFYSRIPIPFRVECNQDILSRALRYLPLVGLIVGAIGWGAFWCAATLLSNSSATIVAIVVMVLATGALHEDGFADFCDGFGGGFDREAVLRIMKDSHIGCYGVIGLILIFLLRFSLLSSFEESEMIYVLILSQGASRFAPVLLVRTSNYVRERQSARSSQSALGINLFGVSVAAIFALMPLYLLGWQFMVAYVGVMGCTFTLYRAYLHQRIGGFTGDTLGALQIIGEILFYVTLLGINTL
ncbi:MAG: adenosylcobinamide-GDP ribazoletransferase [Rikenellaceae bacterium]